MGSVSFWLIYTYIYRTFLSKLYVSKGQLSLYII